VNEGFIQSTVLASNLSSLEECEEVVKEFYQNYTNSRLEYLEEVSGEANYKDLVDEKGWSL
jgi:hypothetical protein